MTLTMEIVRQPSSVGRYPAIRLPGTALSSAIRQIHFAFVDGNKPTALVGSITFLDRNGWDIVPRKEEVYFAFFHLAAGKLSEEELADWLLVSPSTN
jgi:prophage maintenance system killer protein